MIDLCSTEDVDDEDDDKNLALSPIKPRISKHPKKKHKGSSVSDPLEIIKQVIPHVTESGDNHDAGERSIPVLARPLQGLTVTQLFTLMIGAVPADRTCHRKPTSVTYRRVLVIDLSCVWCIDDLRADDNGVWVHGGKPRKKYIVHFDQSTSEIIDATPVSDDSVLEEIDHFTLVRVYHCHQVTPTFQSLCCRQQRTDCSVCSCATSI